MVRYSESHPAPQALTCRCGAVHSLSTRDPHAYSINGQLVRCSACDENGYGLVTRIIIPHTAVRYTRQHGGEIKHDTLGNWYLHNCEGVPIARMLGWWEGVSSC